MTWMMAFDASVWRMALGLVLLMASWQLVTFTALFIVKEATEDYFRWKSRQADRRPLHVKYRGGLLWCLAYSMIAFAAIVEYSYTPGNLLVLNPPAITGAPSCAGASGEGNATDEFIIRDNAGIAELGLANYEKFFVCPGDYTGAAIPTIARDCSELQPCWVQYYSPTDPGTHPATWAWDSADRTHLNQIDMEGASWWRFIRVQWGKFNPTYTPGAAIPKAGGTGTTLIGRCIRPDVSSEIVFDQIVCEGTTVHAMGTLSTGPNQHIHIQRSVIRYMSIQDNTDVVGVSIFSAEDFHLISSEVFDWSDNVHIENQTTLRTVIEDNDLYVSPRMHVDCASSKTAPVQDDNGKCACYENLIDLKNVGDPNDANSITYIIGNRLFGARDVHQNGINCGASGGGGVMIAKSNINASAHRIIIARNMAWDYARAGGTANNPAFLTKRDGTPQNWSIIGNVVDITGGPGQSFIQTKENDDEIYLNTVIGAGEFIRRNPDGTGDTDVLCNVLINNTTFGGGSASSAGSTVGYNAAIASGAPDEQGFTGTNFTEATLANMNFDDLQIEYKLITGPETHTFTNVVPTSASPAAFLGLCPGQAANDTMGSRIGIGVDDAVANW